MLPGKAAPAASTGGPATLAYLHSEGLTIASQRKRSMGARCDTSGLPPGGTCGARYPPHTRTSISGQLTRRTTTSRVKPTSGASWIVRLYRA